MKRWMLLTISVLASALCAQSKENLDQEDLLAAFGQYNPSVLERAAANEQYGKILYQLAASFSMPNTTESQTEMIALVKNFDNSLQLYALQQAYLEGRTFQQVTGTPLETLDEATLEHLTAVLQDVYENTLTVKKWQLAQYKQQIKAVKKDAALSKEAKKEQVAQLKQKTKAVKQEVSSLKSHAKEQIRNTAEQYLKQMQAAFVQMQAGQLEAEQSPAKDVKANHKKPVAK